MTLGMSAVGFTLFVISTVLTVASLVISLIQSLSYKAPEPPVPPPQLINSVPTAEKGKSIPIVFGTRVITQPNVVWWGNPHSVKNQVAQSELQG